MNAFFQSSQYAGLIFTLCMYFLATEIYKRRKVLIFHPLVFSCATTIAFLALTGISYETYQISTKFLNWFLTPATVCLAVPLYKQFEMLKKNWFAILTSILVGTVTSLVTILIICKLGGVDHAIYVSMLPKSITTAIGIGVCEELGGFTTVTVAGIIGTGMFGNVLVESICKLLRLKDPVAKGLAIGTATHAVGTAKALEMGETEGAMGSLSIAVAGLFTVILAPIFANFL